MSKHKIVNVTTGEEILLDYTKKELDEQKAAQEKVAELVAMENQKATAKAAVLVKLGLTDDEVTALLS
jgi:hypothetical protein